MVSSISLREGLRQCLAWSTKTLGDLCQILNFGDFLWMGLVITLLLFAEPSEMGFNIFYRDRYAEILRHVPSWFVVIEETIKHEVAKLFFKMRRFPIPPHWPLLLGFRRHILGRKGSVPSEVPELDR